MANKIVVMYAVRDSEKAYVDKIFPNTERGKIAALKYCAKKGRKLRGLDFWTYVVKEVTEEQLKKGDSSTKPVSWVSRNYYDDFKWVD